VKFFKYLAIILAGIMILVGIIGLFLPYNKHIERQITINAPASRVFPYANNFRKFNEWSPWTELDGHARYTYSGPERGVGAKMQWAGDYEYVGKGVQEILESEADKFVKTRVEFAFMEPASTSFRLSENDGKTTVTWSFDIYMDNTIFRFSGLIFDSWAWVGDTYEQGLSNLKTLVESK
jgi:hypothetical protein